MDALRGTLMLLGVFVHAGTLGEDRLFDGIQYASSLFRMEGFFLISGFMSAMLVEKYGGRRTVLRRLWSVGLPFTVVLVLLNPITLWLVYNVHNPDVSLAEYARRDVDPDAAGPQVWHLHLWFLVSLLLYALCTPAATATLGRMVTTAPVRWLAGSRLRAMGGILLFVLATSVAGRVFFRIAVEPLTEGTPFWFVLKATFDYLPFFGVGVLLRLSRELLGHFARPAPLLLAASGAALLAAERGALPVLGTPGGQFVVDDVFAIAVVASLFAVAAWLVPTDRKVVRYLSDASYTIYLLHYFCIYGLATLFRLSGTASWPTMLLVTGLTFVVTLAIHQFAVLRFTFLRLALNGKRPSATGGGPVATVVGPSAVAVPPVPARPSVTRRGRGRPRIPRPRRLRGPEDL